MLSIAIHIFLYYFTSFFYSDWSNKDKKPNPSSIYGSEQQPEHHKGNFYNLSVHIIYHLWRMIVLEVADR